MYIYVYKVYIIEILLAVCSKLEHRPKLNFYTSACKTILLMDTIANKLGLMVLPIPCNKL